MDVQRNSASTHGMGRLFSLDFVIVFIVFLIFLTANHSLVPTLPIFLTKLHSRENEIGILVGATAIAAMVSRVFVGKMMQRYSEKNMMMSGALLSIFCFISYAT
ncbi:MAG TPA: MFS transporter, partial [Syntrophorhabdaceae bacterium]|nr:MFS transporter [Syntrophorhabdaceae bacterium]